MAGRKRHNSSTFASCIPTSCGYSSELHSVSFLNVRPAHETLTLSWASGEPQKNRLHRERLNGGDVGLAQPSVDYDVDSNPEGWTERLRVKGLHGLWALARWIHHRQPWSLYLQHWSCVSLFSLVYDCIGYLKASIQDAELTFLSTSLMDS